ILTHINGNPLRPVVLMNHGGVVQIHGNRFGISIRECHYLHLSGKGDPAHFYGIQIRKVSAGAGVGIGDKSSDIELDHCWIEDCPIAGIYAKTDPDCSFQVNRENFTQYHTVIHDNYIARTGNEGMYIGSSHYLGMTLPCVDRDTVVLPPILIGVKIYNNIVFHTGWDGIQVSSAEECQIYGNLIIDDSQAGVPDQMSGILIGGGTRCDCYHNLIHDGKGDGIDFLGLAGSKIHDNIIVRAGQNFFPQDPSKTKHGIFVRITGGPSSQDPVWITHNTLIDSKSSPVQILDLNQGTLQLQNNLMVGRPGRIGGISKIEEDTYLTVKDNRFFATCKDAEISLNDYRPFFIMPHFADKNNRVNAKGGEITGTRELQALGSRPALLVNQILPQQQGKFLVIPYVAKNLHTVRVSLYLPSGKKVLEVKLQPKDTGIQYTKIHLTQIPKGAGTYTISDNGVIKKGSYFHY
ncbi:MAG: right-handed parallel beta-helix repeat-containing protein, partial [Bacteroidota bacterium]|nr:right-handed parallel beta-helix repeat-containing protein [Bacteroidota bacterium]